MKIGIIGAGKIGSTLAKLFSERGHEVAISNSRGPETLEDLSKELGGNVTALTAEEAARFGEVAVEAIPFGNFRELPEEALAGKILISASNYYPDRDGEIDFHGKAQTELLSDSLPDTRVVKAFNTIYWKHLRDQGDVSKPIEDRRAIFIAGDEAAKKAVADLVRDIGFGVVDVGTLAESDAIEPGSPVYGSDLTVAEARREIE